MLRRKYKKKQQTFPVPIKKEVANDENDDDDYDENDDDDDDYDDDDDIKKKNKMMMVKKKKTCTYRLSFVDSYRLNQANYQTLLIIYQEFTIKNAYIAEKKLRCNVN